MDIYIREVLGSVLSRDIGYLEIVRFEVFTAVTMKNAVFWDVASEERRFRQDLHGTTAFFIA
jgi:hypothetical protein